MSRELRTRYKNVGFVAQKSKIAVSWGGDIDESEFRKN